MTTVAVLGTGLMGAGMARSLARSGCEVRAWNRTAEKAQPLTSDGIDVHTDPASAVEGADVVLTMLFDGQAVESVMGEAVAKMSADAVWLQSATIGVEATQRCAALASDAGIGFVDAPVLGTKAPAEEGKLVVIAAAPEQFRDAVSPVLDAIGSRTVWVSEEVGDGHRLKLAANSWVLSLVGATAQAIAFARSSGVDPALFLEAISGGPTDCAYAQLKGKSMIVGDFDASFTLAGAAKDSDLIAAALRDSSVDDSIMRSLNQLFESATKAGHGDEDMAAVITALDPSFARV